MRRNVAFLCMCTALSLIVSAAAAERGPINWTALFQHNKCWDNNDRETPFVLEFLQADEYMLNGNASGGTWKVMKNTLVFNTRYDEVRTYQLKYINDTSIEIKESGKEGATYRLSKCGK